MSNTDLRTSRHTIGQNEESHIEHKTKEREKISPLTSQKIENMSNTEPPENRGELSGP